MARKIAKVTTQAELDAALEAKGEADVWICGDGRFVVRLTPDNKSVSARDSSHVAARDSSHVEAWGSSYVEAWGSSHVEAWGSSHVAARDSSHVAARDSSHVEAWGSSHVDAWGSSHVEAWDSSHVEARGSSSISAFSYATVSASKYVAVQKRDRTVTVTGDGVVIEVPPITTAEQWCHYHGVTVAGGIATLYKSVRANYASGLDAAFFWTPGTMPSVPKMDTQECGVGLHAVPRPLMGLRFYDAPDAKFIACPVKVEDLRVTYPNPSYPFKVKFQRVCAPVYEVDRLGKPVAKTEAVA